MSSSERTPLEDFSNELRYVMSMPLNTWDDLLDREREVWLGRGKRLMENYSITPKDWEPYVD